jgi:pantoate--beta-alanine ligase
MKNFSIVTNKIELKDHLDALGAETRGFVPTMGNLHQGHLSLLKQCLDENQIAILSIFVNPTQFAPNEDFANYPRTLEQDINLARTIVDSYPHDYEKHLIIYAPSDASDIYPPGFQTSIRVSPLNSILEGEFRPTHFDGVATVVYLLFQAVKAHRAYFGQKDLQQLTVVKKMVADLSLPIEIIGMPIVRDLDGLALSSRNQYLTPEQRAIGLTLPRTLKKIETMLIQNESLEKINNLIQNTIVADKNWNYLTIRSANDLSELNQLDGGTVAILGTYQVGRTRLLDNIVLNLTV